MSDCTHLDPSGASLVFPDPQKPSKAECRTCNQRWRFVRGEAWIHVDELGSLGNPETLQAAVDTFRGRKAVAPEELERLQRRANDAEGDVLAMAKSLKAQQDRAHLADKKTEAALAEISELAEKLKELEEKETALRESLEKAKASGFVPSEATPAIPPVDGAKEKHPNQPAPGR